MPVSDTKDEPAEDEPCPPDTNSLLEFEDAVNAALNGDKGDNE